MHRTITYRHWLPILTFCPVNNLPDLIYISVEMNGMDDLYNLRKDIRKAVSKKKMFMEDIADMVAEMYPGASRVTVSLMFNRHVVTLERAPYDNR